VRIAIVGKYTELTESYKSLDEALRHGAISNQVKLVPVYVDAEAITSIEDVAKKVKEVDGILVPGGFGVRGTEGKILAIQYARENKIPYLGICLGMQLAVIEFARNVVGIKNATSQEFSDQGDLVIHYMQGQKEDGKKGGTMRLGAYDCSLEKNSLAEKVYKQLEISERHRHRLEVNNDYVAQLKSKGFQFSGTNKKYDLVEMIELKDHPYFIGCQFHPEFKSRPFKPHPLFHSFVKASLNKYKDQTWIN
jgi:CTP synthase